MRNYRLSIKDGHVKYIVKQQGKPVYGTTSQEAAEWMLQENKPIRSREFEDYPIGVKVGGTEYYFCGEWE